MLPAAAYPEREGTWTNFEGRVQRFRQALAPLGRALPDWEILGRLLQEVQGAPRPARAEECFRDDERRPPSLAERAITNLCPEQIAEHEREAYGRDHRDEAECRDGPQTGSCWKPQEHRSLVPVRAPGPGLPLPGSITRAGLKRILRTSCPAPGCRMAFFRKIMGACRPR